MKKGPLTLLQLHVESLNDKGIGVAFACKNGGHVLHKVHIAHAVPGDCMEVSIGRKRKGCYQAITPRVITASQDRVDTKCLHADMCGGCSWQQISYQRQLLEKQNRILTLFSPLVQDVSSILPIAPSKDIWSYRNKMEYTFSENKSGEKFLGLIMTGGKGRVFNLIECHLTHPWFAHTVTAVREFWKESDLKAFHLSSATGSLRTLTLRRGARTGHMLVMLTVSGDPSYALKKKHLEGFLQAVQSVVAKEHQHLLSIFLRIQQSIKGSPTQFFEMHLAGPDHILEELEIGSMQKKYAFKISPSAFFQPNTKQAEVLYAMALSMVPLKKMGHILDLYAGTSTLGILFSSIAAKVTSIEINPHATFDAQVNKELNAADHVHIIKGDVGVELQKLQEDPHFSVDLVVLDPPRMGLDKKALSLLIDLKAPYLIYISCNPKTQAENCKELMGGGYILEKIQPVDQFPHTAHIENICFMRRA